MEGIFSLSHSAKRKLLFPTPEVARPWVINYHQKATCKQDTSLEYNRGTIQRLATKKKMSSKSRLSSAAAGVFFLFALTFSNAQGVTVFRGFDRKTQVFACGILCLWPAEHFFYLCYLSF